MYFCLFRDKYRLMEKIYFIVKIAHSSYNDSEYLISFFNFVTTFIKVKFLK